MKELVLDISHCDPDINLAEWKARHNIYGVIIKAGGYENLGNGPEQFETRIYKTHLANARALGLHVGAYFYDVCRDVATARRNADYFASLLDKYGARFDLPAYMDVEDPRQLEIGQRALTDVISAFCDRMKERGYLCGVYTGRYALEHNMYGAELAAKYPMWIAEYSNACHTNIEHGMWQFGCMSIGGDVYWGDKFGYRDANWLYVDYPSIIENGGGKVPTTKTGWAQTLETCQDPADYAYCTCKVYSCGYSQPKRKNISVEHLKAGTAETDCSAGVSWWLWKGGYLDECPWFYTAIEREYLQEHGFELIDANAGFVKMQRNDVLWRPGHTALYIGDGMQAEALRTERHDAGYDGSTPGDQDQGETVVRKLTLDWDYVIRKREQPTYGTDDTTEEKKVDMETLPFFVRLDEDNTEHLYVPSSARLYAIANADEKKAVIDFFKLVYPGRTIDSSPKSFGLKAAPWGARLNDVLSRGAEFRGFEQFNKHPSLRAVVTEVVRSELNRAQIDEDGLAESVAQKVVDAIS